MSTPIGHSILAIAVARLSLKAQVGTLWRWYIFAILAANAPDFDFLPGLFMGDINRFHQGPSHSIVAAVIFATLSGIALRKWLKCSLLMVTAAGILFYGSHLFLDYFREDSRAPFGIPLLWPFSDEHWISSLQIFKGIRHGVPGDNASEFFSQLLSQHNLIAVGLEIIILFPVTVIIFLTTRRKPAQQRTNTD